MLYAKSSRPEDGSLASLRLQRTLSKPEIVNMRFLVSEAAPPLKGKNQDRCAISKISWLNGNSAESQCDVTSSARSSPVGSSPGGCGSGAWASAVVLSWVSSRELVTTCERRRFRSHQAMKPTARTAIGIDIQIASLEDLFRVPFPALL